MVLMVFGCATEREKDPCGNPEYIKISKQQAQEAFSRADYYEALADILEAKRCNPKDPEVYYWLGQIYWRRVELDKAKENFSEAIKLNPKYSEAYSMLGDLFMQQNNYDAALENYKKAAGDDLYKDAFYAENNMGWIYFQQGQLAEAEQAYTRALVLNPNFCPAYASLGELRSKQKQYGEAQSQYQKALALCPKLARAHNLLGMEYSRQGKTKDACMEFGLALKTAPAEGKESKDAAEHLKFSNCPAASK